MLVSGGLPLGLRPSPAAPPHPTPTLVAKPTLPLRPPTSPELEVLNLSSTNRTTDTSLRALAVGSSKLRRLDLESTDQVTDAGVATLVRALGGTLTYLGLLGCSRLTAASTAAIAQHCTKIDITKEVWRYKFG